MLLSYIRTIILYLILIAVVRLMGKRQLGQMEPAEFVVTMLVANLAAIPMQDGGIPLLSGLVPILTVLGVGMILSVLSLRLVPVRRWLCGKPVILIENGKILQNNLQGALPAIALDGHPALSTAYTNDCEPLLCFAQQVNGYGREGDVFLGISTSGNSQNVMYAATVARAKGMKVIGLTGGKESKLSAFADVCIRVPRTMTYQIQELHLPVYHCLCLMLEERFFGEG